MISKQVLRNAFAGASAKYVQVALGLLLTPYLIHRYGTTDYGMMVAITALATSVSLLDFGLGSAVVAQGARPGSAEGRSLLQIALRLSIRLSMIISCGVAVMIVLSKYGDFSWLRAQIWWRPSAAFALLLAIWGIPLLVIQKYVLSQGGDYVNQIYTAAGAVAAAAVSYWLACTGYSIELIIVCISLVGFGVLLAQALRMRAMLALDSSSRASSRDVRSILAASLPLWGVQILSLVGAQSDVLIVAAVGSADGVSQYYLYQRIYALAQVGQALVIPLWPVISQHIASRERSQEQSASVTVAKVCAIASVFALAAFIILPYFISWWLSGSVPYDPFLSAALAINGVLACAGGIASAILSTNAYANRNLALYAVATTAAVALKVVLWPRVGATGLVLASSLGYLVFYTIPAFFIYEQRKR